MDSANPQDNMPGLQWPPLPKSGFLSGRVATQEDIDNETAVFGFATKLDAAQVQKLTGEESAQAVERPGSEPIHIVIPQYAFLKADGQKHACIIIQAEEADGSQFVACRLIENNTVTIGLLEDFELLGKDPP